MLTINNTLDGYLKDVEIKGNTIQDTSNLADIKSVGDKVEGQELYEIPVLSHGKNLFNGELKLGTFDSSGNETASTNRYISDFIKLDKGTYILSSDLGSSINRYVYIYDLSKNYEQNINLLSNNNKFTLSSSKYVRLKLDGVSSQVQLEEGTVATPYEPYQEDKLTILSPTPLEKVGDVADRLIEKDGVWGVEKNVETVVFDGTEDWWLHQSSQTNCITVRLSIPNRVYRHIGMSNLFVCKGNVIHEDIEGIMNSGNANEVYINVSKSKATTLLEWKNYLSENNMIFLYVTNNPTFIPLPHDQQVKLRTFANKTNISFGCEIEGTIKAQVPKSLGATVNTHTTQISNLNKELDRVKKLEESTVSTVETESDFTTVEATSNGYFEDVKLEGKTLVNLSNSVNVTRSYNQTTPYETISNIQLGKLYTLIVKVDKNTCDSPLRFSSFEFCGGTNGVKLNDAVSGDYAFCPANTTGVFALKVGVKVYGENGNGTRLVIFNSGGTVGEYTVSCLLLEGDHTQNPPSFFEGLKSVGQSAMTSEDGADEIVVSSVNENLFDMSRVLYGKSINSNNGDIATTPDWCVNEEFIPVVKGVPLYISRGESISNASSTKGYIYVYQYSKNKVKIDRLEVGTTSTTFTPTVDGFIRIALKYDKLVDFGLYRQPNVVVPHKSDKKRLLFYNEETQTWEKPVLRQWDSIEKHADGKYYYHQRSGEVVLNGSESNIGIHQPSNSDLLTFRLNDFCNDGINNGGIICNNFKNDITSGLLNKVNGCRCAEYSSVVRLFLCLEKAKLSTQDVAGFKQWLQTNNVTVVYQLAQEKVYECTNIDLITYANETNYIVESGAIVPRTTLKVHNNISNVVSLLQKKVSLLESNITKYMITQNRMQLASTYSADSVTFKVDYFSLCGDEENYDEDLYNLILNNILVGKDNYNYDKMFTMILDYASWNQISWEQFDILVGLMDMQHNPPIEEIPTDDEIVEETPNEIM